MENLIEKLKKVELEIFKVFVDVCSRLDLKYYVIGGTLLGAVRHQGFIPWDDDIDVGMPREDYEIFIRKAQAILPDYYFLQNTKTDNGYLQNFSKIRDSRTTFIETTAKNHKINHGVYIDIFPLDGFVDNNKLQNNFFKTNSMLKRRIGMEYYRHPSSQTLKYKLGRFLLKLLYPSIKYVLEKRDRLYEKYRGDRLVANHGSAWGKKEIFPKEWYSDGVVLKFEECDVMAPKEWDKILTQVYGDYMTPPPEDKRSGHHYTDIIDLENPYTKYVK